MSEHLGDFPTSSKAQVLRVSRSQPMAAFQDIWDGLVNWRIWMALSWSEFIATYKRSYFGLIWVVLSFAGFVFVKLIIFSSLIETDDAKYYNAFLVVGLYVWMHMTTVLNGAPDTFISVHGWIRSEPLPFSLYVFKSVMREFYNFVLMFIVVILAFLYIDFPFQSGSWMCLLAVVFYLMNAFSIKLLLGLISARLRDVSHLVKASTLPLMFLTPVFWLPSQMPDLMVYLWWNPLFHYIEIFRVPLLTGEFPVESWIFTAITFAVVSISALLFFAKFKQRLVFWF